MIFKVLLASSILVLSGSPPTAALSYSATVLATSGIFGYWRLGESSGDVAADAADSNPGRYNPGTGTWTGGTLGVAGIPGGGGNTAVSFSSGGAVNVEDTTTIQDTLANDTTMSLEFWVYVPSAIVGAKVGLGHSAGAGSRAMVQFETDGNIYVAIENGGASFPFCAYSTASTAWYHVGLTYDGSQTGLARTKLYINGVLQTLSAGGATPPTALAAAPGGMGFQGDTTNTRLDEVAIYTSAVSAATWADHYNVGH